MQTGRQLSAVKGSRVSSKLTVPVIDAPDHLAGRVRIRWDQYAPQDPIVAFSGGAEWYDNALI